MLWIFDPDSGLLVLQNSLIVRVDQAGFHTESNHYLWKKKEFLLQPQGHKKKQATLSISVKKLLKATFFI